MTTTRGGIPLNIASGFRAVQLAAKGLNGTGDGTLDGRYTGNTVCMENCWNIRNSGTTNKKKMILRVWPAQTVPCKRGRNQYGPSVMGLRIQVETWCAATHTQ